MGVTRARRGEIGQGTVEWVGLIVLVAAVVLGLGAGLGARIPGGALAGAIGKRLICAVRLARSCAVDSELDSAYGAEIASLVAEHAPRIRYEPGMIALPVDYRRCRADACAAGAAVGEVWRSLAGERVSAFVHVVDCRSGFAAVAAAACIAERPDAVYLQYWLYYPGSATAEGRIAPGVVREVSAAVGHPSFHPDDWESYQVRLRPGAADSRSSSHHGYEYDIDGGSGWGAETGTVYVSGGSHAGNSRALREVDRFTPRDRLRLIPLEPILTRGPSATFADPATPPWSKRVWRDPEYEGTD